MNIFYWDFFGPRAEGTAVHFHTHLEEFLDNKGLQGCEAGTESQGSGHCSVFCKAPDKHAPTIEKVLRPQRMR